MKRKICFTGGGTAGHVFPGLSVIDTLCADHGFSKSDFIWIGSSTGMEKKLVEDAGISFVGIPSGKLRRYFSLRNFFDIFKIALGLVYAFCILLKVRPSIVFSKGGYVSVPPVAAARFLRIPVMTHESDYTPGLATKINSVSADRILLSVEETLKYIKPAYRNKAMVVGNPVRKEFYSGSRERGLAFLGLDGKKPVIFAVGGSQGSGEINDLVYSLRKELAERFCIVHQTGVGAALPPSDTDGYIQLPFIRKEIADVIAAADLVITRAGAGSLWELAAEGKASVLIPLRGSGTRGDQVKNADFFRKSNAAAVLDSDVIEPKALLDEIYSIMDTDRKKELEKNISGMSKGNSASLIAEEIMRLIK